MIVRVPYRPTWKPSSGSFFDNVLLAGCFWLTQKEPLHDDTAAVHPLK